MIDHLKRFIKEAHVGLEVSELDAIADTAPLFALYDDHYREVYRGNVSEIIAFINGCVYIRDLYEGR